MRYRQGSNGRRRAVTAVYATLTFTLLLSVVALGTDGGLLLTERRSVQAAADAAALAAGGDLYTGKSTSTADATALALAQANGYNNDGTKNKVEVNQPPKSGSFSGKAGYVEVIVTSYKTRSFSAMFGSGNLAARARAVARGINQNAGPSNVTLAGGIILLAPTGTALDASLNARLTLDKNTGKVIVNSSDEAAVRTSDFAALSATQFDVVGGIKNTGSGQVNGSVNPEGVPSPIADPLASLQPPDLTSLNVQSAQQLKISGNKTVTLNPGIYLGGISISGNANVTMKPGIYYIEGGGLVDSGNGAITGNGVMIYNGPDVNGGATGPLQISGNGDFNITPPTSGPYQGIAIYQDRSATSPISVSIGNGAMNIGGLFYAPSANMTISSNAEIGNAGQNVIGSQYILNTLTITGNGEFALESENLGAGGGTVNVSVPGGTVRKFGLVE